MTNNGRQFPALGILYDILAIPYNFLTGFIVGVVAPVAAIAAMVFGVRFLTGRMPFLSLRQDPEDQERRLSVELVAPDVLADRFEVEKQKVMDELSSLQAKIKSMREEFESASGSSEAADAEG
ncbi:MAG TPA: hypothetical protein VLY63_28795 [Anaerolineae bacterium]|nr:hypothetical protein [Anaerolineae bacterium]